GVTAMRSHALAHRKIGGHVAFIERGHVGRWRRRRRAEDVLQHEDAAKYRRGPRRIRRDREEAALPQQAAAMSLGCERHAAESASVDVWNSVVLRQAFIEERVVRPDQIEHAAILAQHAVEEELRFLSKGLSQVVIEVPIKSGGRSDGLAIAQPHAM